MKGQSKQMYIPCELKITKFCVERGFAQASAVNAFNNVYNGNNCSWEMAADGNGEYKNEGYSFLDGVMEWDNAQREGRGM